MAGIARPMLSENNTWENPSYHTPVSFCWKAPPIIGRLEPPIQKIKENGFPAVISVYSIIVGVAIQQVSC